MFCIRRSFLPCGEGKLVAARDEMGQLAHAVAEMDAKMCELLKELTGLIVQTDATSRELSAVVEKISVQGQKIANSAEQIASGKKETLVSAEEISAARIDLKNGTKKLEHKDGDRPVKIGETETAQIWKQSAQRDCSSKQEETNKAFKEVIHNIMIKIQAAVDNFTSDLEEFLNFIDEKAVSDYHRPEKNDKQHGKEVQFVRDWTEELINVAFQIAKSIDEVNIIIKKAAAPVENEAKSNMKT